MITTTRAGTAFALCFCDDGVHADVDLAGWHSDADRADRDRLFYPASQPGHIVRMDTTVKEVTA